MSIITTKLGNVLRAKGTGFDPRSDIPASDTQSAIEYLRATIAGLSTVYQPLDSDLTAIAALTTTAYGRSLLTLADLAALVSALDPSFLTPAEGNAAYQPLDSDLTAFAALTPANDDIAQRKAGAWVNRTIAQLLVDLAALGTTFQPLDADLTAIAALTTTTLGRSLLAIASAAAGFDALAPTTTRGDIIFRNATVNARLAASTAGYRLQTNGASADPTWAFAREILAANRTYYVRTDGSNSNDGLANTSGGAWLTIQYALDTIIDGIDSRGFTIDVQVGAGTYTGTISMSRPVVGGGVLRIIGDATTPSNVVISCTNVGQAISVSGKGVNLNLSGLKITVATAGHAIAAVYGATITVAGKMDFGAVPTFYAHMLAQYGGVILANVAYNITGVASYHMRAEIAGSMIQSIAAATVTITGSPAFGTAFAYADTNATIYALLMTYSGTVTGKRYSSTLNSVINTAGSGANYFPGDVAGTTGTGGQYA